MPNLPNMGNRKRLACARRPAFQYNKACCFLFLGFICAVFKHSGAVTGAMEVAEHVDVDSGDICDNVSAGNADPCPVSSYGTWYHCGNACFYYSCNVTKDWFSALLDCEYHGGHLASVLDKSELNILISILAYTSCPQENPWIGLVQTDYSQAGNPPFKWIDGNNLTITNNWAADQPKSTNAGQSCVQQLRADGKWRIAGCVDKTTYICKVQNGSSKPDVATTITPTKAPFPSTTRRLRMATDSGFKTNRSRRMEEINGAQGDSFSCPDTGSKIWKKTPWSSCYYHSCNVSTNWFQAFIDCEALGGSLVSLHNETQSRLLEGFTAVARTTRGCPAGPVWIGLANNDGKESFIWMDNTGQLQNDSFTNWMPMQPNSYNSTALVTLFSPNGSWTLDKFYSRLPYICSKPLPTALRPADPVPKDGMSKGLIAVCVIVPIIGVLIIIIIAILLYKYRHQLPCTGRPQRRSTAGSRNKLRNPFGTIKQVFKRPSGTRSGTAGSDNPAFTVQPVDTVPMQTAPRLPTRRSPDGKPAVPLRPLAGTATQQAGRPVMRPPTAGSRAYSNRSTRRISDSQGDDPDDYWEVQLADFEDDDGYYGGGDYEVPDSVRSGAED